MGGLRMHGMRLGSAVVQSKIMHFGTQWTHGIMNPRPSYAPAVIQVQPRYPQVWFLGCDIELKKYFALQLPHTIQRLGILEKKQHGLM